MQSIYLHNSQPHQVRHGMNVEYSRTLSGLQCKIAMNSRVCNCLILSAQLHVLIVN
jgi:hypothetical protein